MKVTLHGTMTDNGFQPNARYMWSRTVKEFAGRKVSVTVELYRRKRTNQQNRYYWPVIVSGITSQFIEDGILISKEETHDMLRGMFLKKELLSEKTGEVIIVIRHTPTLSTVEMNDYCEHCRRWAAETLNLILPEPNEDIEIEY